MKIPKLKPNKRAQAEVINGAVRQSRQAEKKRSFRMMMGMMLTAGKKWTYKRLQFIEIANQAQGFPVSESDRLIKEN